jgi:hypothetical protein
LGKDKKNPTTRVGKREEAKLWRITLSIMYKQRVCHIFIAKKTIGYGFFVVCIALVICSTLTWCIVLVRHDIIAPLFWLKT